MLTSLSDWKMEIFYGKIPLNDDHLGGVGVNLHKCCCGTNRIRWESKICIFTLCSPHPSLPPPPHFHYYKAGKKRKETLF